MFKRNFENISDFKIRSTRCDVFPCIGVEENEMARLTLFPYGLRLTPIPYGGQYCFPYPESREMVGWG